MEGEGNIVIRLRELEKKEKENRREGFHQLKEIFTSALHTQRACV